MLEINIDFREKSLIELIRKNKDEVKMLEEINKNVKVCDRLDNIKFVIENLKLGDINFVYNGELILIIERKSLKDLISSVKDGRYKEQKARMKASGVHVMYIIEELYNIPIDKHNLDIYGMKVKQIFGLILNSMFRDNIQMLFTKNVEDTYQKLEMVIKKYKFFTNKLNTIIEERVVEKIVEKIVEVEKAPEVKSEEKMDETKEEQKVGGKVDETNEEMLNYVGSIKTRKKDNRTGRACYLQQLCVIPGVSAHIANTICMNYPSMFELCMQYNNVVENQRPKMLSTIEISLENDKKRKLGKVLSERIYKSIMAFEE